MGSVTASMFDVGNSIMCTGGTYAFVAMLMLGLLFHIEFKKEYMGEIVKLVVITALLAIMGLY